MSGPKSGGWHVVPAGQGISAAECQRLLRHYLECILNFRLQLEALQRRHPELQIHVDVDSLPPEAPGSIAAIVTELNNRYEIYIRLRDEVTRVEGLIAARDQAKVMVASLMKERQAKLMQTQHDHAKHLEILKTKAENAYANLDAQTAPERRKEIEASVKMCLETTDMATAELRLTDLLVRVRRGNQEALAEQRRLAAQRDTEAKIARDLLGRCDALGHTIDATLHDNLIRISSGDAAFTETLHSVAEKAITAAEQRFASNVLKESLEQLGYEVQEGFETLFAEGGSSFFQRASWGEHHVRVTVDLKRQRLNLDVVRYGIQVEQTADQVLRDKEMEEQWCGEVPGLIDQLAAQGLSIDFTRKLNPGTVALQVISDERLKPVTTQKQAQRKQGREHAQRINQLPK